MDDARRDEPAVAFVAAEATPFFKTGGLADVVGSLPGCLNRAGVDARVFLPNHRHCRLPGAPAAEPAWRGSVEFAGRRFPVAVSCYRPPGGGACCYLIDQPEFFGRDSLYGPPGGGFSDNARRFAFYCRACLAIMPGLDFRPRVVHCHDWHTALVPLYLREMAGRDPFYDGMASVFTIHNLGYQGVFPREDFAALDLPETFFTPAGLEFYGRLNLMKAGLIYADRVTTVSSTYAGEILLPEGGFGLDGVLRARAAVLSGILNGIDCRAWNPATDRAVKTNFGPGDLDGKAIDKADLCRRYRLPGPGPLLAMVSRLVPEKGLDLVREALPDIIALGFRLFIVGGGLPGYESFFRAAADRYRGRFAFQPGFSDEAARRAYAGADFFLMPSLYEPCGLGQMIALRYGAAPVVRKTGGLADSVVPFDGENGTGFFFDAPAAAELSACLARAVKIYGNPAARRRLLENALAADFCWEKSARAYIALYRELLSRP